VLGLLSLSAFALSMVICSFKTSTATTATQSAIGCLVFNLPALVELSLLSTECNQSLLHAHFFLDCASVHVLDPCVSQVQFGPDLTNHSGFVLSSSLLSNLET